MSIDQPKILLVEGNDEVHFFNALLKKLNINDIQIIETGGKDKFKSLFAVVLTFQGFEKVKSIGITRDADNDKQAAVESIKHQLGIHRLPVPKGHSNMVEKNGMKVGIYVLPGNAESGMLENLVLNAATDQDVLNCSDAYIKNLCATLEQKGKADRTPNNIHKARAHAYLAGMKKLVSSVGLAANKGYFNFDSPELLELKTFLKGL